MQKIYSIAAVTVLIFACACSSSGARDDAPANSSGSSAQPAPDRGQSVLEMGGGKVAVEYGRPALKGRELEGMISPGDEWRMGSNAATTLSTDIDLKFGDKTIPKGKYILKAKLVEQQNWLLIIQTEAKETIAEVPLTFERVERAADLLTIELTPSGTGGRFRLHWGNLTLSTNFDKA